MIFPASKIAATVCIADVASAGVFRLPIARTTIGWDIRFLGVDKRAEAYQAPLGVQSQLAQRVWKSRHEDEVKHEQSLANLEMPSVPFTPFGHSDDEVIYWSMYTTPISIGNPPLNLTALVDTSWGPFFVPSANCTLNPRERESCLHHAPLYNSSESSTYRADLTPCKLMYRGYSGVYTRGNMSQDNIHVADMEIKGQVFEEATFWHRTYLTRDDLFDTALGLSLHRIADSWGNFSASGPFQNMIEQDLLHENIFTLTLPRVDREMGELTLGGLPESLDSCEMIEVPLNHSRTGGGDEWWDFATSSGWQISAQSISMDSPSGSIPIMTSEHTAIISSSYPYISLPHDLAAAANHAIGLEELYDWVDCETRLNLPNMTFALGPDGLSITLTPWDYLIEVYDDFFGVLKCVSPFQSLESKGEMGFIMLGAAFLNGVWSVWNAKRGSISFANRPL
ncbi:acid protease [Zopfia rhizophila CBS 207.26]|uniref:Acid protease n=1 Tax=Zopfia rhizophila CBS 207.26 TaxID=1314779 RepID=A0A6A6E958_9PEZI|nr:acid protease [Zopfia rhizophila CBS 207.26]